MAGQPISFIDPEVQRCPFAAYAAVRAQGPVYRRRRHFCIGNQLSRGELRIAFTTLLRRMKNIRLADGEASASWVSHFLVYGPYKLDIVFDRS